MGRVIQTQILHPCGTKCRGKHTSSYLVTTFNQSHYLVCRTDSCGPPPCGFLSPEGRTSGKRTKIECSQQGSSLMEHWRDGVTIGCILLQAQLFVPISTANRKSVRWPRLSIVVGTDPKPLQSLAMPKMTNYTFWILLTIAIVGLVQNWTILPGVY